MKRLFCLLVAGWMLFSCAMAEENTLDAGMAKAFKQLKTTGATVYVAKNGKIVYEYHYGYADKKTGERVSEDTYFRLASVTKLVAGIHVMQLVEDGLLDLDASIGNYLGYEVKNLYYPDVPVTLRHLMSHTSSLSPYGGYSVSKRPLQQILDASLKRKGNWYRYAPGSKYDYSNFGAGIMGSLVECVTGKNINDSITETLFEPLGIDAALHPALVGEPEKIATQYNASGNTFKSRAKALASDWDAGVNPDMHFRITVGSVWMRGRDLCRLGMMMAQNGYMQISETGAGTRVLKQTTVQEMMADQKGHGYVTVSSPYGLCVNRVTNLLKDRMIYGHQGLSDGVLCNLYWDPQTQFVFVLISNGCNTNMNDRIGILSRRTFQLAWEEFGE